MTNTKTKETTTIAFADVADVDTGLPRWAKIVIWAGAAYAAVVAIGLIIMTAGGGLGLFPNSDPH
jgi:hypothetical protein